jgi:hypothetical protein
MSNQRIAEMMTAAEALATSRKYKEAAAAYEAIATYAAQEGLPFPYAAVMEAARNYGEYGKLEASKGNLGSALEAISKARDLLNQVVDENVPEELRQLAYKGKSMFEDVFNDLKKAALGSGDGDDEKPKDTKDTKQASGVFPWLLVLGVGLYLMRRK